jgi:3',5'-cyclic AMP phosphodiesterase CpdA
MEFDTNKINACKSLARRSPIGPGLKIVCISDTHGRQFEIPNIPDGDILIHAGDFSSTGTTKDIESFVNWFDSQMHPVKIFIAGNHDTTLDTSYYISTGAERFHRRQKEMSPADYSAICRNFVNNSRSVYLEDSGVNISFIINEESGNVEHHLSNVTPFEYNNVPIFTPSTNTNFSLNCYGAPWQPEFCDWAFNLHRGAPIKEKWDKIPFSDSSEDEDNIDILITHGPPHGFGDETVSKFRCGCEDLLNNIQNRKRPPRLHVFGHIHEDYGT